MTESIFVDNKKVGEVINDWFITHREVAKKHFFVKGQGYPISYSVLLNLKSRNVTTICIIEKRTDSSVHIYTASLEDYFKAPQFKEINFDLQNCLKLKDMQEVRFW